MIDGVALTDFLMNHQVGFEVHPRNSRKIRRMATKQSVKTTAAKKSAKAPAKAPKRTMSADHKAKLAQGRMESRVMNKYLEALAAGKGKRGRKRTPESISLQIARLERALPTATAVKQLELTQQRLDLIAERDRLAVRVDLSSVEKDFVKIAKSYATRNAISYGAFRAMGVPADILKRAGIARTRG
jgi:uncharacterized Ntn-hydrolase superfamily protein